MTDDEESIETDEFTEWLADELDRDPEELEKESKEFEIGPPEEAEAYIVEDGEEIEWEEYVEQEFEQEHD